MAGNREYKMAIKIAGEIEKSFPNSMKMTKSELRAIAREASASSAAVQTSLREGINQTKPMFDKIGRSAKRAFRTVTTAATVASVAIGSFAVNTGMAYESQMSTVRALSQANQTEMQQLDRTAQHLGATTVWTAKESGQAMEYMAMAGWDAKQMVDAVPATMDLASASGEDLALVTDIVTDSMTAFSMKADEAGHFTDVLAAAATSSNTNVGKLGESFKYAAPLAGSLGYNIEDTALSLGLMANSGIKASQAGTSIRSWLTRMAKPTEESGAAMKKLGLSLKDSHGKMKPLREMIDQTRNSFKGLSKSQKAEYAAMLAGKTGMSGLLAVVNSTDVDYQKLRQSIDDCNGAAKEMAEIKLDNLEGDVTLFKSAMDGAGLEIYNEIKEPLREVVSAGTKWVSNFAKDFKTNFPTIRRHVSQAGDSLGKLAKPLLTVGGWLLDHPDVITGTIVGIGSALAAHKVVSGISGLAASLSSLGTGGLAVLGITGAVGIVGGISAAIAEADRVAKDASLDKHFGDVSLNMEEIQSISKEIVGAKKLERVSELLDSMSKSKGFADELKEANSTIKKMNWKVSAGLELSDADNADYESSVRQYVSSAQDLIDQQGYEVNIATSLLFEDSPEKMQILKDDNYFFRQMDDDVNELSDQIEEKVSEGVKKGFSPNLQEEINGLLEELSKFTEAEDKAKAEAKWNVLETEWSGKDLTVDSYKNLKKELQTNVDELKNGAKAALETQNIKLEKKKNLGYIDDAQYETERKRYEDAYQDALTEADNRGIDFMFNTVMDTYGESFLNGSLTDDDKGAMNDMLEDIQRMGPDHDMENGILATKLALQENSLTNFNDWLETTFGKEDTGRFERWNEEATVYIQDYFKEKNGKEQEAGEAVKGTAEGTSIVEVGFEVSKEVDTTPVANKIKTDLKTQLESGSELRLPINVEWDISQPTFSSGMVNNSLIRFPENKGTTGKKKVKKHANGGIFSTPHIGMVAEAGYDEAIIPIDGSANAYNLLGQTAQMLGVNVGQEVSLGSLARQILLLDSASSASHNQAKSDQPMVIQYSPSITIEGDADKETVESVLSDEYEKFKRYMKQWEKDGGRLSLA